MPTLKNNQEAKASARSIACAVSKRDRQPKRITNEKTNTTKRKRVAQRSRSAPQIAPEKSNEEIKPPELLEEITEDSLMRFVGSLDYYMQDKSDGHSRGAIKQDGRIFGINKKGQPVPLPAHIVAELERIKLETFQIDAEIVGDRLVCRDLLVANADISALPYETRFVRLVEVITLAGCRFVSIVETFDGAVNKATALDVARAEHREGVVFKLKSAPYRSGRNGQHKKFKFVKTLSAIAGKPHANGKASVEIFLIDKPTGATRKVRVANVSLIGKTKVSEGDVLEVAYLYAFPSKKLCQARMLRTRPDVEWIECTTAQLIFKREEQS